MIRPIHIASFFLSALLLLSCGSSRQSKEGETAQGIQKPEVGPGIPPDHCRLVGTVVKIEAALAGGGDDPCSKAPCVAEVRVDEVLGYGAAFTSPLKTGQNIRIKFTYTTGPTKELFPGMSPTLPGLKVGSRFETDLRAAGASMEGSGNPRFQADQYSVK